MKKNKRGIQIAQTVSYFQKIILNLGLVIGPFTKEAHHGE
jgi:hypothetical protein